MIFIGLDGHLYLQITSELSVSLLDKIDLMKRVLLLFLCLPILTNAQIITTIAGNGTSPNTGNGGLAVNAGFNLINGVSFNNNGKLLICSNGCVRKLDTLTGIITRFAGDSLGGTALGDGGLAYFAYISPITACVDNTGNTYISDNGALGNPRIRKVNSTTGIITTIAGTGVAGYSGDGGPATSAEIKGGWICLDTMGNLFIADTWNFRIRKVNLSTGIITTYAGTGTSGFSGDGGPATAANVSQIDGICSDLSGNIYFGDRANGRIRKVNSATGIITTFAGNGIIGYGGDGGNADTAKFNLVSGMTIDNNGHLYFADRGNNRVRKINAATHVITTIAGNGPECPPSGPGGCGTFGGDGGPATSGYLHSPQGVCIDNSGNVYVGDYANYRVRKVGYGVLTPTFIGGAVQPLNICVSATGVSLSSLMSISDPSVGLTDTWSVIASPLHGTLGGFNATATSTGGIVIPTGTSYTPVAGYTGTDAFTIKVKNGQDSTVTTINVTVNPMPSAITGIPNVCVGNSTSFSASPAGGVWSSSSTTIAPIVYATGVATGMTAGTSLITYMTAPGCIDTAYLTVLPLPASITGPDIVCAGENISLTNSTVGGTWSSSNANVTIGVSSGTVAGVAVGTSIITYMLASGCLKTATVSVSATPSAISGSTNICVGLATSLTATPAGGFWYSSDWPVAIVSGLGLVTTLSTGTVTISYTLGTCMSTKLLTVFALPEIAGDTTLCQGSTTLLNNGAPGGSWSSSDISVATISTVGLVTGLLPGTSLISYTLSSGCNTTKIAEVNDCTLMVATNNGTKTKVIIYPNPAQKGLTIISSEPINELVVTDLLGRVVYSNYFNSQNVQLNIADWLNGSYILKINGQVVRQFIKR